ncbi:MAG: hypothetical protein K6E35_08950 [Bacteroidales bacterium]|nr:hypothetical protein [Bacteroidales bacterium]
MLHSNCTQLPGKWMLSDDGYIPPKEYVPARGIEALFRTPKRMEFFLRNSSKARRRLDGADEHLPAFRDQTILAAMPDLCRSLFQKDALRELTPDELSELARQIRFRFSADANQIARVCGLSYAEAARLLDSV